MREILQSRLKGSVHHVKSRGNHRQLCQDSTSPQPVSDQLTSRWCCSILSVSITCLCECESENDCDTFFPNSDKDVLDSRLLRRFVLLLYLSGLELVYHHQGSNTINVCLVFLEDSSVVHGRYLVG
jgi:hypothetical protein